MVPDQSYGTATLKEPLSSVWVDPMLWVSTTISLTGVPVAVLTEPLIVGAVWVKPIFCQSMMLRPRAATPVVLELSEKMAAGAGPLRCYALAAGQGRATQLVDSSAAVHAGREGIKETAMVDVHDRGGRLIIQQVHVGRGQTCIYVAHVAGPYFDVVSVAAVNCRQRHRQ